MISRDVLESARGLASRDPAEGQVVFRNNLGDLQAQLYMDVTMDRVGMAKISDVERVTALHAALSYLDLRLADVNSRLNLMNWLWNDFSQPNRTEDPIFYYYGGLLVKDFHQDVVAVMDSVAPVVILATQTLKRDDKDALPGFADVLPGSKRTYRRMLPNDLREIVDETQRWWRPFKAIRDLLAHREHNKLVFGPPTEGKMFQVYDRTMTPQVIDAAFFVKGGNNVVNFERYAAFLWAEIMVLLDRLGPPIANYLGRKIVGRASRHMATEYLLSELDVMIVLQT